MNGISLKQASQNLSAEQAEVLVSKKVAGQYKPRNLVKLLKPLVVFDTVNDDAISKLRKWRGLLTGCTIILCLGFTIHAIATESFELLIYALFVVPPLVTLIVVLGRKKSQHQSRDLEDDLRQFLFPFAMLMQDELQVGSKLAVEVDADLPTRSKYLSKRIQSDSRYGRSYRHYLQPWFSARGVFVDQSQFAIECEKRATEIEIVKRSASGKTKHKSKFKLSHVVKIKMLVPRAHYERSTVVDSGVILVEEVDGYFAIKGKYKHKSDKLETLNLEKVLSLIYHMYSMVTPKV